MATILVAVDGSKYARKVAEVAGRWAHAAGDDVVLLHVRVDRVSTRGDLGTDEAASQAAAIADEFAAVVRDQEVNRVTTRTDVAPNGEAAQAILDVAEEVKAEMIVLGHRGTSSLRGLLVGSTAHKVLHLADRPVLVVR